MTEWEEAESAVAEFLAEHGWKIRERNYRIRSGEIDIIAERDGAISFVEVKQSSDREMTLLKIDTSKRRRMTAVAAAYLSGTASRPPECRFDLALVSGRSGSFEIEYMEDVFRPESFFSV